MRVQALFFALLIATTSTILAQEEQVGAGEVQLPLDTYNQLVDASRTPVKLPPPAPASYALGTARMTVNVAGTEPIATGEVRVDLAIRVLEDGWVAVPVLPAGTPVDSVTVGGKAVQLIATADGLAWSTQKAGSYSMALAYRIDAARSEAGFTLAVPAPRAASISLTATLPGTGLDIAVIPSAGTRTQPAGASTRVNATVPTTSGVHISWRSPSKLGHAVGRAVYSGELAGDAVTWTGSFGVEIFSDETVTLKLLPRSATLRELKVDGKDAAILIEGNRFATLVKGRGRHTVVVGFQVPVIRGDGPPRVDLVIPPVPVSRFDISLPGRKEVTVTPSSNVSSRPRGDSTVSTVFVPMTERVSFSWAEAVPEAVKAEVRANAGLYHTVHAEEGVLYVRAMVVYEVTRGETSLVKLEVPADVQVNRIEAPSGAVADWRIADARGDGPREVSVFLDRKVTGELMLEVSYDRSLGRGEQVVVPLLRSNDAQRQRGMVALLSSRELTLKPVDEGDATRVGENQLPAFVREAVEMTVAHTFKYVEDAPRLIVEATPPERKQGRFDAQVDTLISLGEVTMRGAASVEVNVKSGGIMELELTMPEDANLLSLTGPSLRTHTVEPGAGTQVIDVQFTQEMEGQFRLELSYESKVAEGEGEAPVPTVGVRGADVEQGRLAVEALSAVEVQAATVEQLSPLDINELPQQLVLRTTNPILLAYRYARAEPPHKLTLTVTRHRVVEVQEAAIDQATYQTLFTRDGMAVTTARFVVRNSRKQFLRVKLPKSSKIWSAFVDGKPEKPALEDNEGGSSDHVLIKIITSTRGFEVQLIYATEASKIGGLGTIKAVLPRPEILVTQSRWDVYLPDDVSYSEPSTNMNLVVAGVNEDLQPLAHFQEEAAAQQVVEPLRLSVPTSGIHFAFDKLYANQGDEEAWFSIAYASGAGATVGKLASLLGTLLLWLGIGLLARPHPRVERRFALIGTVIGGLILAVTVGLYRVSATSALLLSLAFAVALAALVAVRWWRGKSASARPEVPPPVEE